MAGQSWKIYWNEYAKDTYLYGAEVSFHAKDDVEFKNELIQPGAVIKRWFSKVNYQAMRVEPSLPLIDGEGRYHISLDASAKPAGGLLLRLLFYDRYDSEAGSQIIRDGEGDFQCPLKTYSYEVQLINGGVTQLHFHSITITEVTDGE
ncbi:MAG: accessory Sec system protein Asp3 [Lachnospiraceae bacterium]|jgi:accessory secretory protein Asp3|nr:accessory Sec system protein Asp3 [Lachnospiraceae bacterium]NBJ83149.1 accessory Sec system protein Asp3 [bacterium 1XD42-76]NBK06440.1 accessory Sec system protein Asp3 [bacterium 1XD42-94]